MKVEDEECVKLEEVAEPTKEDCESKQHPDDSENKDLQFIHKETQPVQNDAPAEIFVDEKIVLTEKVSGDEENTKVQKQSPITILSEDETYLLEEDKLTVIDKTRVGTKKEFDSQEDRTAMPKKKNIKFKEFASVIHQGKSLKMVGELAPGWRPKTRPKNKLRLNMKKLLNPKLNTEEVTVLDTSSSDENLESSKGKSKGRKPLNTIKYSSLTETKLSAVFLELRGEMLKEQQKEEKEVSYSENKLLMDEMHLMKQIIKKI